MLIYHQPRALADALQLLSHYGTRASILAGGASLFPQLRDYRGAELHVISLQSLDALRSIRFDPAEGLLIGALATHREIEQSPLVQTYCPALASTFSQIANPRIRNQGTIGGNIVHHDVAHDPPPMLREAAGCSQTHSLSDHGCSALGSRGKFN